MAWTASELDRAAFDRALTAMSAVGHAVTAIDLVATDFRATMPPEERTAYHDELHPPAAIRASVDAVRTADAFVFLYPTVASIAPPPLRGWLERVMLPGVAFVFDDSGRVRPGLTRIKAIVGISTYEHSWPRVKWDHDNGRRMVLRALRLNTGLRTRTKWVAAYDAPGLDAIGRTRFLARVEAAVTAL